MPGKGFLRVPVFSGSKRPLPVTLIWLPAHRCTQQLSPGSKLCRSLNPGDPTQPRGCLGSTWHQHGAAPTAAPTGAHSCGGCYFHHRIVLKKLKCSWWRFWNSPWLRTLTTTSHCVVGRHTHVHLIVYVRRQDVSKNHEPCKHLLNIYSMEAVRDSLLNSTGTSVVPDQAPGCPAHTHREMQQQVWSEHSPGLLGPFPGSRRKWLSSK